MGINDILCLFIIGLVAGILGIHGAVFCSFPNMIYICGLFAMGNLNDFKSSVLISHQFFGSTKQFVPSCWP
jgi:hypothetical protein